MFAVVSHTKNVMTAPDYAYNIDDNEDNGFTYQNGDRYGVVWFKESKMYAYNEPNEENEVEFGFVVDAGTWTGCIRRYVKTNDYDTGNTAFTYVYYPKTKDLYCIAVDVDTRDKTSIYSVIVVTPASWHPMVQKFSRHQYLMNKWRKLTPLIGKWSLFFNLLYTEVTYRPGNVGATNAFMEFKNQIE